MGRRLSLCLFATGSVLLSSGTLLSSSTALAQIDLPVSECAFSGTFEQDKALRGLSEPLRSTGTFFYHCQHGVIWSTTIPLAETLVLKRDGGGFVIRDLHTTKLQSRHGKFLGGLLNNLMGSNVAAIEKQFEVERLEPNTRKYQLTPKKRALKRGVKQIAVTMPNDDELDTGAVLINITDRNAQQTEIRSIRSKVFTASDDASAQCQSVAGLSKQSCKRLLGQE